MRHEKLKKALLKWIPEIAVAIAVLEIIALLVLIWIDVEYMAVTAKIMVSGIVICFSLYFIESLIKQNHERH